MFGGSKVKLDKDLLERCKQYAEEAGYSSVEEFIAYTLEREIKKGQKQSPEDEEKVAKRLKGLGYIE
jgi:metal-responsive CopG/Arc/MetJ family transcriptional regulator